MWTAPVVSPLLGLQCIEYEPIAVSQVKFLMSILWGSCKSVILGVTCPIKAQWWIQNDQVIIANSKWSDLSSIFSLLDWTVSIYSTFSYVSQTSDHLITKESSPIHPCKPTSNTSKNYIKCKFLKNYDKRHNSLKQKLPSDF